LILPTPDGLDFFLSPMYFDKLLYFIAIVIYLIMKMIWIHLVIMFTASRSSENIYKICKPDQNNVVVQGSTLWRLITPQLKLEAPRSLNRPNHCLYIQIEWILSYVVFFVINLDQWQWLSISYSFWDNGKNCKT